MELKLLAFLKVLGILFKIPFLLDYSFVIHFQQDIIEIYVYIFLGWDGMIESLRFVNVLVIEDFLEVHTIVFYIFYFTLLYSKRQNKE